MTLLSILDAVDPSAADEMERLIRRQATDDAVFYEQVKLECDLGVDPHLEHIHGLRSARWSVGTGGGHHRHHLDEASHH